jgi:hypothetical protein
VIRAQMSGHCATPSTENPESSHDRCALNGGGNKARPSKEFQPCPCPCHYEGLPTYECECGGTLVETRIENDDPKDIDPETGELYPVYFHLAHDGSITTQECP